MAALEQLLSQARRHCTTRARASLLGFHKSFCSSSSPPPNLEPPQANEFPKQSAQSVPIQEVSYPVKPKDQSEPSPENSQPQTPSPTPPPPPPPPRRPSQPESDSGSAGTRSMWTREDIRYVKDAPVISTVSYPSRVAPLPEDRVAVEAEAEEEMGKDEGEEMEKERMKIEADNRIRRRVFRVVEEEKVVPFPRLIKVEKKQEQRVALDLMDAIREVKANANRKFDETVEAHVRLGIDRRRSDMTVRGSANLPHGSGKVVRVAVFAEGTAADDARAAGADIVGGDELIDEIKNLHQGGGKLNFDRCISTPQMMPRLTKISRILRSLMPNANRGTVTIDISKAVQEAKRGRVEFRMDKTAIVHVGLGKVSFSEKVLRENIGAFVNALLLAKPVGLKKTSKYAGYVNSFHLCSTMGPGFPVSIQSISMAADNYNKLHAQ